MKYGKTRLSRATIKDASLSNVSLTSGEEDVNRFLKQDSASGVGKSV